jgi:transmembrane protein EpsG
MLAVVTPFSVSQAILWKQKGGRQNYRIWFFLSLLIVSLAAAFRGTAGTDSLMYRNSYNTQVLMNSYREFEAIFSFINRLLYKMGFPYQVMFFVVSCIQSFFVFKSIEYESEHIDVRLAAFIYVVTIYLDSYNAMRQYLAVSISIYAILLYLDNKWLKSVILIFAAAQIHRTSYIVFVLMLAKFVFERRSKLLTYFSFGFIVFCVFNRQILNEMYKFFSGTYTGYLSLNVESEGSVFLYFIKTSVIIVVSICNLKNYREEKKYYTIFGLVISGVLLTMLEYVSNTQVGRIAEYFTSLEIFLMAYVSQYKLQISGRLVLTQKQIKYIVYIYFAALSVYNFALKGFSGLFPYGGA